MIQKDRYTRRKGEILNNKRFNSNNKDVIKKFLEFEEYKLKRKEGLTEVDERSYKTLNHYLSRIKNINIWFKNKDWSKLTKKEIKKLIDDLEDGVIKNRQGKRYEDRSSYYQMFQGKFFGLIKRNHIARQIIEDFSIKGREFNKQVRFIEEEQFRKIVDCALTPEQRCLLWLAFDIGENIGSLLELEKEDLVRQIDPLNNEPEYLVILNKEKLKRSRTPRSELTNYKETVEYLDIVLKNLKPTNKKSSNGYIRNMYLNEIHKEDKLFKFGLKAADTFFKRAVKKAGVRCLPGGEIPSWKDLRSSMACCLLGKKSWSVDEVNSRLGHAPNSRVISRYVTYLSLDKRKPKEKVYQTNLTKLEMDLEKQKETNKLQALRFENLKKEQDEMKQELKIFMSKSKAELLEMLKDVDKLEEK